MTHPQKGMTLDERSLGDSHEKEAGLLPPIDKGLTEAPETLPSTYFCTWHGEEAGKRRASTCLLTRSIYVRGRQRDEIDAAPFLACTLTTLCCLCEMEVIDAMPELQLQRTTRTSAT